MWVNRLASHQCPSDVDAAHHLVERLPLFSAGNGLAVLLCPVSRAPKIDLVGDTVIKRRFMGDDVNLTATICQAKRECRRLNVRGETLDADVGILELGLVRETLGRNDPETARPTIASE